MTVVCTIVLARGEHSSKPVVSKLSRLSRPPACFRLWMDALILLTSLLSATSLPHRNSAYQPPTIGVRGRGGGRQPHCKC